MKVSSTVDSLTYSDDTYVKQRSAVVLFIVHNNINYLGRNFAIVDCMMQRTFRDVLYCIYENDSSDGTAEWLSTLARNRTDIRLKSEVGYKPADVEGKSSEWRFKRLAACRNECLALARQHAPHVDYGIVLDIDFVNWDQVCVAAAIREIDKWDPQWKALGGSGLSQLDLGVFGPALRIVPTRGSVPVRLYDAAALRTKTIRDPINDREQMVAAAKLTGSVFDPPLRVLSAFGGIAVYKPDALYPLQYEGYDCEHVCLHRRMQNVFMSFKLCPLMVSLDDEAPS